MRLFSNKDVTGKKRLLTFKGTKGLAGIELNLKRELYAPAEITPITDCPLDQNKVWIKYDWNNRRIDPTFDGQLVIRDINEIVCNPGEAEIGSPIPYYGYPIALEPGATYRLTVNFEGQARVRARYNVDGEWLREADTDYNLIIGQQDFTTITRDFTIPQGNVVWAVLFFSCGSSMEAEYYSVFIEKL